MKNSRIINQPFEDPYNAETQSLLIRCLVGDQEAFSRCRNIIKEDYFTDHLRPAVRFLLSHTEEYHVIPHVDIIAAKTNTTIEPFIDNTPQHQTWLLKEVEGFCKHKALELAVIEGVDLIQTGRGAELEQRVKAAMQISLISDIGENYFTNPKERLERMRDKSPYISTGWSLLDKKLYGGFARGTLNIFAGGSGCVVAGTKIKIIRLSDSSNEGYSAAIPEEVGIETISDANTTAKYLCYSPDGWVPVEQWKKKGIKQTYEISLDCGLQIASSHDHLFQKYSREWCYTRDLKLGDVLLTEYGPSCITEIENTGDKVVYDLAIGHENHRYYTNGVSSHNSGKSLFLQNIALNWAFAGLNILYISLELSADLIKLRLDAMVTGKSTSDVFREIDDVSAIIAEKSEKAGKLYVKKFPEGGTTANDLRAFIKEFEIRSGVKLDGICVDYLDLMYPNNERIDPSDLFTKDKFTSEELRGLVDEFDLLCATASQLNRDSVESKGKFDHSHIAGGISKINTCDNLFAIFAPSHLKEKGKMQLLFLKTRTAAAVGQRIDLAYSPVCMLISDAPEVATKSMDDIKAELSVKKQKVGKPKGDETDTPSLLSEDISTKQTSTLDKLANMKAQMDRRTGRA